MSKRKESPDNQFSPDQAHNSFLSKASFRASAGAVFIAVLVVIAYYPSLKGDFIFDDELLLTQNKIIKAPDGLYQIWFSTNALEYYPISYTVFWIEWRLWGLNPIGYHAVSLVLHVFEAVLIWLILRKLSIPGAFFAAIIFSVHPVNVESVAWIAQLRNLMTLFFCLLSTWCYITVVMPAAGTDTRPARSRRGRHERTKEIPSQNVRRRSSFAPRRFPLIYWLSLLLFVLALLSKGSSAILPLLLLGIVWWVRTLERSETETSPSPDRFPVFSRGDFIRISPFFAVAVLSTGVNIWFQTHGSGEVIRVADFTERLLGAGGVVWFYLYKALLPCSLSFVYPQWRIDAANPFWWLLLAGVLTVTVILWRYRRGWGRALFFCWFFFCVALVPVMGFTDVGYMQFSLVADHYQHIAIIGVIALVSAGFSLWRRGMPGKILPAANAAGVAAAAILLFLTWRQSGLYRDDITLYRETLNKYPDCWLARNNLGLAMLRTGQFKEAIKCFQRVLEINPNYSPVYNNMGEVLIQSGRPREALKYIRRSLELNSRSPEAYCNMGRIMFDTGQLKDAADYFQQAIKLKSDFSEAYYYLGMIQFNEGRIGEAIKYYQQAIQLYSDYPAAHNNLAIALVKTGRIQDAIDHFKEALRSQPDYPVAEYNLGIALGKMGRLPEAIEHYEKAIRLKHDYVAVYYNLTQAYFNANETSKAVATARKGLELAQSQGMESKARQFEDWLNSRGVNPSDRSTAPPRDKSDPKSN